MPTCFTMRMKFVHRSALRKKLLLERPTSNYLLRLFSHFSEYKNSLQPHLQDHLFIFNFQWKNGEVSYSLQWAPGLDKVWNALDETPKPALRYFDLGFILKYGRFSFLCRQQQNGGGSFTRNLKIDGSYYPFRQKCGI